MHDTTGIAAIVTRGALLDALEELTINNPEFDPDRWSKEEADRLISIGQNILIRKSPERRERILKTSVQ